MAQIDVTVETEIAAAPADVAAVMFDPQREPEWMSAVQRVEVIDPALAAGARVKHTASFMGKEMTWTTTVEAVHFPHVLKLQLSEGPFAGTVSYQIQRSAGGSAVRVHNEGTTSMVPSLLSGMLESRMRSSMNEDLERLKALVEQK
jgi:carbon monoxide dehydrogenase subunit G